MLNFSPRLLRYGIALLLIVAALSFVLLQKNRTSADEGYRFDYVQGEDDWAGPRLGEQIDLRPLKNKDGSPLAGRIGSRLNMLVLIDPQCGACQAAADQLRSVREQITARGVPYYMVSITSTVPRADYFSYASGLNLDAEAYLWTMNEAKPSAELYSMVLPSHILVDAQGRIVRKWPGTSPNDSIRRRMAHQIVADTLTERAGPSNAAPK
ncbi:MAG: hypothetical protein JWM21_1553 [Acidobacteria bacterium]|nr:hypothetical protein [Acidobacteriota bacterium]